MRASIVRKAIGTDRTGFWREPIAIDAEAGCVLAEEVRGGGDQERRRPKTNFGCGIRKLRMLRRPKVFFGDILGVRASSAIGVRRANRNQTDQRPHGT